MMIENLLSSIVTALCVYFTIKLIVKVWLKVCIISNKTTLNRYSVEFHSVWKKPDSDEIDHIEVIEYLGFPDDRVAMEFLKRNETSSVFDYYIIKETINLDNVFKED